MKNYHKRYTSNIIILTAIISICISTVIAQSPQSPSNKKPWAHGKLKVSENNRFLQHEDGTPFFWMADTAWLLFQKLDRSETQTYLQDRKQKGFNVIQVMVLHELPEKNVYGSLALSSNEPAKPLLNQGPNGYWENIDFVVDTAASKGLYMALVPAWGHIVKSGYFSEQTAKEYASFLAKRYKDKPNIIWLNGGDLRGDIKTEIWQTFGNTIHELDTNHLMTFHPFGRMQSSTWFHAEQWLDFNFFQSGHRNYNQIPADADPDQWKGEDNWKYVLDDYSKTPAKPTIDGEPSYENIPQGLHDPNQPYWQTEDTRRYAYWSVFAGACGHTFGNNAVMQMHKPDSGVGSYGVRNYWYQAINDPGAGQMQHLKNLILSRPYFNRINDQSLVSGQKREKYERLLATRGEHYALIYSYTSRPFHVNLGKISGDFVKAWWYNPRSGQSELMGEFENSGVLYVNPPGQTQPGNDWVLVLDDIEMGFSEPGIISK